MSSLSSETELVQEVERLRAELASRGQDDLTREVEQLRLALARREQESAEKERLLERYAADLGKTFKSERAQRQKLSRSYTATVRALSNAVEFRDAYTGKHAERVAAYGLEIARRREPSLLDRPEIEFGFLLHDIGKVAIPDAILHKPGALTESERRLMAQHPVIGAEIVSGIEFLDGAVGIVRSHHERWDGKGYPDRLAEQGIPLPARVFSVADVFDALTTERPYRQASSIATARRMIRDESGKQFDPLVVAAFESIDDDTLATIAAQIG